jgi:probable rRNA maturation factor
MELLILWRTGSPPWLDAPRTLETFLDGPLRAALRREGVGDDVEISLLLCDDAAIRALNAAHRGLDKATDVLSFAQEDPHLLGDIVISLETAARQAHAAGWPPAHEVALLAVHGLLHLLGHEDDTAAGAALMRDEAAAALAAAGVPLPDEARHPFFARFEEDEEP